MRLLLIAAGAALLLTACGDGSSPSPGARGPLREQLAECKLEGLGRNARCAELEVPENPAAPQGRKIKLHVAVLPALAERPAPDPVFILAGGPGQAASRIAGRTLGFLSRLRRERDLVFVDQRGTGKSNPLHCDLEKGRDALDHLATPEFPPGSLRVCLAGLSADPRFYTTHIAMADLDQVREALGYERVNLWGASYGTRAALEYARQFPRRVRSLVLDSVAPPSIRLPLFFPRDSEAALLAAFADCAQDVACQRAFPTLAADYEQLLARFASGVVKAKVVHPRQGQVREVSISRDTVQGTLRAMLYLPETASLIPLTLREAARGNFGPLVTHGYAMSDRNEREIALGMYLSVVCAEDLPRITPEELAAQARYRLLGQAIHDTIAKACAVWPRGEVPAEYFQPVQSELPALLLSGRYDPVTPPQWGEEVAARFPRSRHLIAKVGHNVSFSGCVPELITRFVREADASKLDASCVEKVQRPHFFLDFAGPGA
ncbi:Carboxylesterase A [Burkholderiales bacterium]|nr:Carboxylesterase A [Burkholderiales bacterium]